MQNWQLRKVYLLLFFALLFSLVLLLGLFLDLRILYASLGIFLLAGVIVGIFYIFRPCDFVRVTDDFSAISTDGSQHKKLSDKLQDLHVTYYKLAQQVTDNQAIVKHLHEIVVNIQECQTTVHKWDITADEYSKEAEKTIWQLTEKWTTEAERIRSVYKMPPGSVESPPLTAAAAMCSIFHVTAAVYNTKQCTAACAQTDDIKQQ